MAAVPQSPHLWSPWKNEDRPAFRCRGKASMAKVLVIEDDDGTADEIVAELVHRGYEVERAATGDDGLARSRRGDLDAMIVDRMLPGLDGLEIIATLRREQLRTPVLVLSAL